jgi:YHS domain-containing protein
MKNGIRFIAAALLVGIVLLAGCQKKSEPAAPPAPTAPATPAADANAVVDSNAVAVEIEQTTCPVMGGKINKEIFTEYQGKKVYFCCAQCKADFEKEPEKYLSKLPQFQQ